MHGRKFDEPPSLDVSLPHRRKFSPKADRKQENQWPHKQTKQYKIKQRNKGRNYCRTLCVSLFQFAFSASFVNGCLAYFLWANCVFHSGPAQLCRPKCMQGWAGEECNNTLAPLMALLEISWLMLVVLCIFLKVQIAFQCLFFLHLTVGRNG